MPVIIIGGIRLGIFSATEAGYLRDSLRNCRRFIKSDGQVAGSGAARHGCFHDERGDYFRFCD